MPTGLHLTLHEGINETIYLAMQLVGVLDSEDDLSSENF